MKAPIERPLSNDIADCAMNRVELARIQRKHAQLHSSEATLYARVCNPRLGGAIGHNRIKARSQMQRVSSVSIPPLD